MQLPAGGPDSRLAALLPPAEGKVASQGKAVAYVCEYGTCQAPTSDPVELKKQVLVGWEK